jgi:hypothetical protein
MAKLPDSFATMGEVRCLPGYCVLLVDRPDVAGLKDLDLEARRVQAPVLPDRVRFAAQPSQRPVIASCNPGAYRRTAVKTGPSCDSKPMQSRLEPTFDVSEH